MLYIYILYIHIYISNYLPVGATAVVTGASARTVSKTPREVRANHLRIDYCTYFAMIILKNNMLIALLLLK